MDYPLTTIEMAKNALEIGEQSHEEAREWWQKQAQIYASVAQAEQLKRIADILSERGPQLP